MTTVLQINTSLHPGRCVLASGPRVRVRPAEGLALGTEDRESSLAGAGKCIELLAA